MTKHETIFTDRGGNLRGDELTDDARLSIIGPRTAQRFEGKEKLALNADAEIRAYVDSWSDDHRQATAELYQQIEGHDTPASVTTHVAIAVAAGQETDTLRHELEQYKAQDADPSTWELVFFVNKVGSSEDAEMSGHEQETVDIIEAFVQDNPDINVRMIRKTYGDDMPAREQKALPTEGLTPPMGTIRSDKWDVILYGLTLSDDTIPNETLGISNDADIEKLSPGYIRTMQEQAKANPLIDFLTCQLRYHIEENGDPVASNIIKHWQELQIERQKYLPRFPISEQNMAMRLGTYAALGGFDRTARKREMRNLVQRLAAARQEPETGNSFITFIDDPDTYLEANSRRIYRTVLAGRSPHHAWDTKATTFQTGIDPVRAAQSENLNTLDTETVEKILNDMWGIYLKPMPPNESDRLRTNGRIQLGLGTSALHDPNLR